MICLCRSLILACIGSWLTACAAVVAQNPELPEQISYESMDLHPLPGSLDQILMLHSNSPERLETPGVVLSTLPAERAQKPFLNYPLKGEFKVFVHHVVRTPALDPRQIWLGLLAHNPGYAPVQLSLKQGNAFLTHPDAPFVQLAPQLDNAQGTVYAGPGDRVSLATLRAESALEPQSWTLEPQSAALLYQWRVPTNPWLFWQQDNALSALLSMAADEGIHLTLVALYQEAAPQAADYLRILESAQVAGPAEPEASLYDPLAPPPKGSFRYGRVAALVQGSSWHADIKHILPLAQPQAYPISALYLKRLGTGQNQSAPLLVRVPGSALESHGNYGLHYHLQIELQNPTAQALDVELALQQPLTAADGKVSFASPARAQVSFRGSLRLQSAGKLSWKHLVLHQGEQAEAFARIQIAAQSTQTLELELVYPADVTPPQLLVLRQR